MSNHQDRRAFPEIPSSEDEASQEERGPICSGILDTRNSGLLNNKPIKVSIRSHTYTPDTTARRGRCRSFPTKLETRCDEITEHKSQTSQPAKERVLKFWKTRLREEPISIIFPACTVVLATRLACLMTANCYLLFKAIKYHDTFL